MKKNTVKIMALAGILCLASVGGVSAYLTDYEKVSNEFKVGKVDIELKEPEWKPEENRIIEQGTPSSTFGCCDCCAMATCGQK